MRLKLVFIDGPLPVQPKRRVVAMREIVQETADKHRLAFAELMGRSQERRVAWPRQEAMYRARVELGQSFPGIGQFFGRDHATIMHGVRRHAERMAAG